MSSKEFDLLPKGKKNAIFRVAFDFYTPRAHFVMKAKKPDKISSKFNELDASEIDNMIETVTTMLTHSGIPTAILSIHRGSWSSQSKMLHVHICVDVNQYLRVYESRKAEIPNWPSSKYVTREWKTSKNPSSYDLNVRGYPYNSYFSKEVAAIIKTKALAMSVGLPETKLPGESFRGLSIVYHPSHPKIGFVGKKITTTIRWREVLGLLEQFGQEYELTDPDSKNEDNGCHLCLYFGPACSDWNVNIGPDVDVLGYIIVSGNRFYKLCPVEKRNSWFKSFQSSTFKCYT